MVGSQFCSGAKMYGSNWIRQSGLPLTISLAKRVHVSRTGHSVSSDKPAKRMICLLTCNCGKVCSVDTSGIAQVYADPALINCVVSANAPDHVICGVFRALNTQYKYRGKPLQLSRNICSRISIGCSSIGERVLPVETATMTSPAASAWLRCRDLDAVSCL